MPETLAGTESVSVLKLFGIRACGTCVKAKAKCIPSVDGGKCQRCNRLNKLCQAANSSSRKRLQPANVSHLEEKLDRLVTLFAASKPHAQQTSSQLSIPSFVPSLAPHVPRPTESIPNVLAQAPQAPSERPEAINKFSLDIEPHEAIFLILEYRTQMESQFPFVVIAPDETAESLQQERPMLWGAIVTAASYHRPVRQEAMGWKMMEEFSSRLLLKAEKSLDLLQGLLVHLSWYHYHSVINPQFMNLLSLAKSLVMSLGYHRTRTVKDRTRFLVDGPDGLSTPCLPSAPPLDARKLEEWRALAGCFYLASLTACSCRKADPLPYTKNLEEGCRVLAERQEFPGDIMISCLVAIQNVIVKSNNAFNEADTGTGTMAPIRMHASALKSELDRVMNKIPADIRQDMKIIACTQIAEISLHEYSLYNSLNTSNDKAQRLNTLYACLLAVKAFFDHHFSLTSTIYASQSYGQWIFCSYALLVATKLCACKAEGWDFQHAMEVLKLSEAMDALMIKVEALIVFRNESVRPEGLSLDELARAKDVFVRYLRHARYVKAWYEPIAKKMNEMNIATSDVREEMPPSAMQASSMGDVGLVEQSLFPEMDATFWQLYDGGTDWMMMGT